jgi:hypothetical protein
LFEVIMTSHYRLKALILFLLWALLAGCTRASDATETPPAANPTMGQPPAAETVRTIPEPTATALLAPTAHTEPTSPVDEPAILPTPREVMEASDPASVNLASGQVQFVEFFAFW